MKSHFIFKMMPVLFIFACIFLFYPSSVYAGYNCSHTTSSSKIPKGTDDSKCVNIYEQCQTNNNSAFKEWGNCSGWGGDEDGCNAITREAWLINPTLCPKDYQSQSSFQSSYFWGTANYNYCQCVEKCGPQPAQKDCWPDLEKCCTGLVEETTPPTPTKPNTEVPKEVTPPSATNTTPTEPLIQCPVNSTAVDNKCQCNPGYKPNDLETCCAKELSAKARLSKILKLYYNEIPDGVAGGGKMNNIYSCFDSVFDEFACGGYQAKILEMLDRLKFSDDCEEASLLDGYDYGPIEALYKWHQAVVIYPKDTDWTQTGLVLDPWPNQKAEVFAIEEWAIKFSGSSYYGINGSSAYQEGYPTVGSNYIDPAIRDTSASEVKQYQQTLSPEQLAQFKKLTVLEKKARIYWLNNKAKVRVHIHSPVSVIVLDSYGQVIGSDTDGKVYDDSDQVYMRTEQMEDGHYSYDIFAPEGEYDYLLTGNDDGQVVMVTAMYDNSSKNYTVLESVFNISRDEEIEFSASSKTGRFDSEDIDFVVVDDPSEIVDLPITKQTAVKGDIGSWFDQNWSQYYPNQASDTLSVNSDSNSIWPWILIIASVLIFVFAVILSVILLILKKKIYIVLPIFLILLVIAGILFIAGIWIGFSTIQIDNTGISNNYIYPNQTSNITDEYYDEDYDIDYYDEYNNDYYELDKIDAVG